MEWLTLSWLFVESVVAWVAGVKAHSLALQSFGIDSVIEWVSSVLLVWRLLADMRGANERAVQRAEAVAERVVGSALLLLAAYMVVMSTHDLHIHRGALSSGPGLLLAIVAAVLMPMIAARKRRVARVIGSDALFADAACSQVCGYMAGVLLLGLAANQWLGWWWSTPVLTLSLVYFVASEGWENLRSEHQHHVRGV